MDSAKAVHVQYQTMQFYNKLQHLQVQVTDQLLISLRVMDSANAIHVQSQTIQFCNSMQQLQVQDLGSPV